ncbi:SprB repeat-containing protein, partial [Tenacibaculum sp.]|nr:SprB repeat-containing protein [Tenacibaculum sp.]
GNSKSIEKTLVEKPKVEIANVLVTDVKCKGDNTGSIFLTLKGGRNSYSYLWFKKGNLVNSIGNTKNLENQIAGDYVVRIVDTDNCPNPAIERAIKIGEPSKALTIVSGVATDVSGFGLSNGSISLTIDGGTPLSSSSYKYAVRKKGTATVLKTTNPAIGLAGTEAGITYIMKVTDANDCSIEKEYTIKQPPVLVASLNIAIGAEIGCFGEQGTISSTVSGGFLAPSTNYTYKWYNTNDVTTVIGTNSNLTAVAGTYRLVVSDSKGNSKSIEQKLIENDIVDITFRKTDVVCYNGNDGLIDITITGGTGIYTYLWSNGQSTEDISNLEAGNYTIKVQDGNKCVKELTIRINEPVEYRIQKTTFVKPTGAGLSNGKIGVTIVGGEKPFELKWLDSKGVQIGNTEEIINQPAGEYRFIVKDNKGCELETNFNLDEPKPLLISINEINKIQCFGDASGILELTTSGGTGGNQFSWYNATTNVKVGTSNRLSNLVAGSYYVKVKDLEDNETTSVVFEVKQPLLIEATYNHTNLSCFESNDGSINISIKGGTNAYSYRLQKDNNTYGNWMSFTSDIVLSSLSKGLYNIQVKDTNGCYLTESGTIATLSFTLSQPKLLTVDGTVSNVTGFELTNGSVITTIEGGTKPYVIEWKDAKGIKLAATSKNLTTVGNGSYAISIKDAQGCTVDKTFIVTQPEKLLITIKQLEEIKCFGDASGVLELTTSGGAGGNQYSWYNAITNTKFATSKKVSNLVAGSYYVIVKDKNENETRSA